MQAAAKDLKELEGAVTPWERASKHAVEGFTKTAALEAAAFGIRVNAIAPGPIETAMLNRLTASPERKAAFFEAVPMKRGAAPEEIAEAIVFVASDKASYTPARSSVLTAAKRRADFRIPFPSLNYGISSPR